MVLLLATVYAAPHCVKMSTFFYRFVDSAGASGGPAPYEKIGPPGCLHEKAYYLSFVCIPCWNGHISYIVVVVSYISFEKINPFYASELRLFAATNDKDSLLKFAVLDFRNSTVNN